ncbi:NAD-dependent deacylase [Ketobacter alkanivorans]|uniref:protein acetyllysine N-acetyltransferase n=1 Tax=Ketobacter alkanivorans TaxID=1917421 RepID=A0A2K9LGD5_9GAMM|nr:NAD-dependent deacylase [Ketobacter alkanivorans]AUM11446.1 NAD-dependent protein deacylase [Ketobacter alkanivorans]
MKQPDFTEIADLIDQSHRILFITGAGLSADSGLPTYRGIGGLYDDADTEEGMPIEVALSGDMLRQRPEITWKYLLQVERACRGAGFNLAHRLIAELERLKPQTWVLTQNIDGFHRAAGSQQLIEIHGKVGELSCPKCHYEMIANDYSQIDGMPICPRCHGVMRPNVVLFGEMLPEPAVEVLHREMMRGFDLVFSVGTTSVFPYISQPVFEARKWNAKVIEINPGITEVSPFVHYKLPMRAVEAMEAIWEAMGQPVPQQQAALS